MERRRGAQEARARTAMVVAAVTLITSLGTAGAVHTATPALGKELQRGGVVLAVRHAATDYSRLDRDPVDLTDCRTQRNLSDQGRRDARAIARGVQRVRLRIGAVLTSAFCRTRETARLAFGRATVSTALLNTVTAQHDAAWRRQIRAARRLLGTRPAPGQITVLVTHGSVVRDTTGLALEEGETLVFRPIGNSRFRLLGRLMPREWSTLRATAASRARP